jgi:hypothetical protein
MKKYIYISIFICSLIGSSCTDFLDTTPTDFLDPDVYYQTEQQLNSGLNSIYRTLPNFGLYGHRMISELGLQADEGYRYSTTTGDVGHYQTSSGDANVLLFWTVLYQGIDKANFLLDNINKPIMDSINRNQIKGETLFLRGYFYFLLVQNYGPVPLKLESSKSLTDGYLPRSSVGDVYYQIWADLTDAERLLNPINIVGFGGRASKSAAQGMLARVALFMAGHPLQDNSKWADAKYWSQKVINTGLHELNPNYEQIFINYAKNLYDYKESIFEVEFFGWNDPPYSNAGRVGVSIGGPLWHVKQVSTYGLTSGYIYSTDWLLNSYRAGDKRRDRNISNYSFNFNTGEMYSNLTTSGYARAARKWDRRDEPADKRIMQNSCENHPILRYADILLMFAEANNEIDGNSDSTYMCLNMVRRRGMGLPINLPNASVDLLGLSKDDLRKEIQAERAREFCYETLRKGDIVRWGIFLDRMKFADTDMQNSSMGTNIRRAYFTNATARDTLWPIPDRERGLNPKLTQNSGW